MATVVNVGDSRLYHVAMGQIRQVTKDHSLVQMMVDRGELTLQDAKSYPGKNMITRAVGTETAVQCDVFHLQLERGDAMLLCSDGLSNLLDEQEILFEVVYEENGQRCCERLLEIAENRGAPDNVTCVLAKF
jgi:protein phosphatase